MTERAYTHPDGSFRSEIVAAHEEAAFAKARERGIDSGRVDALMAEVEERGFTILPELFSREAMTALEEELRPLLQFEGRSDFEGFKTRRIYSVIQKTLSLNPMVEHPLILSLLDRVLMPNYLLSQLQAIEIQPGEVRQPLHHDDAFYPIPRPRPPIGAAVIWAVDDFTADNGATLVAPGSHRWGDVASSGIDTSALVPAVMPAGSALFFIGTLWHCAGPNQSDAPRMATTAQYCEPWARQQENYSLAVSRDRARLCSDTIQSMLGYSMLFPFIGFVDGRDPKRLLHERR